MINAFRRLSNGSLDITIMERKNNEFGYLFESFNEMVKRLKQSIEQNYEQKMMLQYSELKQLQSQINPHFLYNCFYNINRMCKVYDVENAMFLSEKLANYYNYITRNEEDFVPLSVEYQHAKTYADIQSVRFANRIRFYSKEIPEDAKNIYIPRMILQPILENAYKYAFTDRVKGGSIYFDTILKSGTLTISVQNDGVPISDCVLEDLQWKLKH